MVHSLLCVCPPLLNPPPSVRPHFHPLLPPLSVGQCKRLCGTDGYSALLSSPPPLSTPVPLFPTLFISSLSSSSSILLLFPLPLPLLAAYPSAPNPFTSRLLLHTCLGNFYYCYGSYVCWHGIRMIFQSAWIYDGDLRSIVYPNCATMCPFLSAVAAAAAARACLPPQPSSGVCPPPASISTTGRGGAREGGVRVVTEMERDTHSR